LTNINTGLLSISGDCICNEVYSTSYHTLNIIPNNQTIIHNVPIFDNINNYQVGIPVFINDINKIYKMIEIPNEIINKNFNIQTYNKYRKCSYQKLDINNYINNSIDQVPKVSYINNGKFIGICTSIIPANTVYTINKYMNNQIIFDIDTIDFATHGDYVFKIKNNIEHNLTSGESRKYQIGDEILYDGTIIDQNYPITRLQENNSVGIITYIPDDNTDYVSVFKK